jgi:hypothetical protein
MPIASLTTVPESRESDSSAKDYVTAPQGTSSDPIEIDSGIVAATEGEAAKTKSNSNSSSSSSSNKSKKQQSS